ncbi:hypothetical protein XM50_17025 [Sphingomonas sp. Ag1]|nr:hypothetical protein XM50_17025 [Sphingomonas sp. Ag1]
MARVSTHRSSHHGDLMSDRALKGLYQVGLNGVDVDPVEALTAIRKFAILEADAARQFQDKGLLLRITLGDAFVIRWPGKGLDGQLASDCHGRFGSGRIDAARRTLLQPSRNTGISGGE